MKKFFVFAVAYCFALSLSAGLKTSVAEAYEKAVGEIVNGVIEVEFADTTDGFDERENSRLDTVLESDANSLKSFIYENSEGKLSVRSEIVGKVVLDEPSSYYTPAYKSIKGGYQLVNEVGYDNRKYDADGKVDAENGMISIDYVLREQEFIRKVFAKAEEAGIKAWEKPKLSSVTFVVGKPVDITVDDGESWGDIFWPHKSNVYYGETSYLSDAYYSDGESVKLEKVYFDGSEVENYLLVAYSSLFSGGKPYTSILCHEFMHVIGAPDYYRYDEGDDPVGNTDIMGDSAKRLNLSLSYLRYKMGWIEEGKDILAIEESGEYALEPTENSPEVKAYKIVLSDYLKKDGEEFSVGDCYYIECRKTASGTGLIIYRVNEKNGFIGPDGEYSSINYGNAYGDPEVYVYRDWVKRPFSSEYYPRSEINVGSLNFGIIYADGIIKSYGGKDENKNIVTDSDGNNTGVSLKITGYDRIAERVTFQVEIPEKSEGKASDLKFDFTSSGVYFDSGLRKGFVYLLESEKELKDVGYDDIINSSDVKKIPVSFKRVRLSGKEGYVYVFADDGNERGQIYSAVYAKDSKKGCSMLLLGVGLPVGAVIISAGIIILLAKTAKRVRNERK